MDQKRIPIGFEDFKKFKEEDLYLVQKHYKNITKI